MVIKVNCKYNDQGAWCTNKNVKRSLFGLGARCCSEREGKECSLIEPLYQRKGNKPNPVK